jgi:hypothetical protein
VGRYKQALADAEYILTRQPSDPRAQLRVKNIKAFTSLTRTPTLTLT